MINEDRLGLDRVYVQAKRYRAGSVVGRPAVQGFVRSPVWLGASKGVSELATEKCTPRPVVGPTLEQEPNGVIFIT